VLVCFLTEEQQKCSYGCHAGKPSRGSKIASLTRTALTGAWWASAAATTTASASRCSSPRAVRGCLSAGMCPRKAERSSARARRQRAGQEVPDGLDGYERGVIRTNVTARAPLFPPSTLLTPCEWL
jgi:hypothetical protein